MGESLSKEPFLFNVQKISKANYGVLNSCKKRTKLTILSKEDDQTSEFCSFYGRIEEILNCSRDLLTSDLQVELRDVV